MSRVERAWKYPLSEMAPGVEYKAAWLSGGPPRGITEKGVKGLSVQVDRVQGKMGKKISLKFTTWEVHGTL